MRRCRDRRRARTVVGRRTQVEGHSLQNMNLDGNLLVSSVSRLTALIDRALADVHVLGFPTSKAVPNSRCSSRCSWQRVAREGWMDHALSWVGWYPWQYQKCLACSHFRRRS